MKISTQKLGKLENFMKTKLPKLGLKNALFRYFWGKILKNTL